MSRLVGLLDLSEFDVAGRAAIAYHLAKYHGVTNIAVLDKSYLGGGNTARNTAVIRSNYLTDEGISFYRESVRLFANLSNELSYNIMYERRGQLTLAHSDAAIRNFRWRAEMNKHLGVHSELIDRAAIREPVPNLRMDENSRYPIIGGLWHADGATARHDAMVWGYMRGACNAQTGADRYAEEIRKTLRHCKVRRGGRA